jgi:hypothetical protein
MTGSLSEFERAVLSELAGANDQSPAGVTMALDTHLGAVLDTVADLRERGLLARTGFDTCRVTDRGRAALAEE